MINLPMNTGTPKTYWLPLKEARLFAGRKGLKTKSNHIEAWVNSNKPKFKYSIEREYRRALYMTLFQWNGYWGEFIKTHWKVAVNNMSAIKKYENRAREMLIICTT
jgi:hypothetical protein